MLINRLRHLWERDWCDSCGKYLKSRKVVLVINLELALRSEGPEHLDGQCSFGFVLFRRILRATKTAIQW